MGATCCTHSNPEHDYAVGLSFDHASDDIGLPPPRLSLKTRRWEGGFGKEEDGFDQTVATVVESPRKSPATDSDFVDSTSVSSVDSTLCNNETALWAMTHAQPWPASTHHHHHHSTSQSPRSTTRRSRVSSVASHHTAASSGAHSPSSSTRRERRGGASDEVRRHSPQHERAQPSLQSTFRKAYPHTAAAQSVQQQQRQSAQAPAAQPPQQRLSAPAHAQSQQQQQSAAAGQQQQQQHQQQHQPLSQPQQQQDVHPQQPKDVHPQQPLAQQEQPHNTTATFPAATTTASPPLQSTFPAKTIAPHSHPNKSIMLSQNPAQFTATVTQKLLEDGDDRLSWQSNSDNSALALPEVLVKTGRGLLPSEGDASPQQEQTPLPPLPTRRFRVNLGHKAPEAFSGGDTDGDDRGADGGAGAHLFHSSPRKSIPLPASPSFFLHPDMMPVVVLARTPVVSQLIPAEH